jgi:hypothetical protein
MEDKTMNETQVTIPDLDEAALLDLRKELGAANVTAAEARGPGDVHHELLTSAALITLTPVLARLLAKWILKHRRLQLEVVRKRPDGSEETIKLDFSSGKEAKDEKSLLERITDILLKVFFDEPAT